MPPLSTGRSARSIPPPARTPARGGRTCSTSGRGLRKRVAAAAGSAARGRAPGYCGAISARPGLPGRRKTRRMKTQHPGLKTRAAARSPAPGFDHSLAESFALAARIISQVLGGASLTAALATQREDRAALRAAAQDLSYKALRAYGRVNALADRLTGRPLEARPLYALLLAALAAPVSGPGSAHSGGH